MPLKSLQWSIYAFISLDYTKLPCYTLLPAQHHSFFRNLAPLSRIISLFLSIYQKNDQKWTSLQCYGDELYTQIISEPASQWACTKRTPVWYMHIKNIYNHYFFKVGAHYLCLGFDWCRQTLKQEPRETAMAVASPWSTEMRVSSHSYTNTSQLDVPETTLQKILYGWYST